MLISHAQNFEDIMLWRALGHIKHGFYIDVGACHPTVDSVTKLFYDKGWNGINIEPDRQWYSYFKEHRSRDINLDCAIGEQKGEQNFYSSSTRGWSTLSQDVTQNRGELATHIPYKVAIQRLSDIIDELAFGRDIHFLKIDVEGTEYSVLQSIDLKKHRPWIVIVETMGIGVKNNVSVIDSILNTSEYVLSYSDGLNNFYVANEHRNLCSAFKYPPNIYDNFQKASEYDKTIERDNAIIKYKQAITERDNAVTECSTAVAERAQTQEKISRIVLSRSWRITAFLRYISRFFSSLTKKIKNIWNRGILRIKKFIFRSILAIVKIIHKSKFLKSLGLYFLQKFPFFREKLASVLKKRKEENAFFRNTEIYYHSESDNIVYSIDNLRYLFKKKVQRPLLTICITTYNRGDYIKISLNELLKYAEKYHHLLEVIVCDNCSNDNTKEIVQPYIQQEKVQYFCNERNVGMLGNLGVCANIARGDFVWIIGDDDIILESIIERILYAITSFNDLEIIYTNYMYTHLDIHSVVQHEDFYKLGTLITEETDDRYVKNLLDISANTENFFTAIYCCIFRRDHALAAYNQDTSGSPFSSLLTCVPTTNYVLNNLLDRPAFWVGKPAVLVNMNVSWLKYADLWVLERFPEIYERFVLAGLPEEEINKYRKNSLEGIKYHFKNAIVNNSENLSNISLETIIRTYQKVPGSKDLIASLLSIAHKYSDRAPEIYTLLKDKTIFSSQIYVEGPFVGSYSLAIVNRNIAHSLSKMKVDAVQSPSPTEGEPFHITNKMVCKETWDLYKKKKSPVDENIIIRYTYPPTIENMDGCLNIYHSFGWEEGGFDLNIIESFNKKLDGITVMSHFVKKILIDHGLSIPIYVTGLGIDHDRLETPSFNSQNKKYFEFLHISSCFPRKGVDILIEAFCRAFSQQDNARLTIKTIPNIHHNIEHLVSDIKCKYKNPPRIRIINEEWPIKKMQQLYQNSDVFVLPSKGEGFGLPVGEALCNYKPVIATGYGGHLDMLKDDYPWLIDYNFSCSSSHLANFGSYWVEPSVEHLVKLLKKSYKTPLEERLSLANKYRTSLLQKFKWEHVASRMVSSIVQIDKLRENVAPHAPMRIGMITTWGGKCGIAQYSKNIISEFSNCEINIIASQNQESSPIEGDNKYNSIKINRTWSIGKLEIDKLNMQHYNALIVQYQPSFFDIKSLVYIIKKSLEQNIYVYIVVHNVNALVDRIDSQNLIFFISKKVKLLLHAIQDLNLIKEKSKNLLKNSIYFPHAIYDLNHIEEKNKNISENSIHFPFGIYDNHSSNQEVKTHIKIISSFGFLLPHKNFISLVKAFKKLYDYDSSYRLNIYCSYLDERSESLKNEINNFIIEKSISHVVNIDYRFLDHKDIFTKLTNSDIIVFPYEYSSESFSGAVCHALSSARPIVCTPTPIFADIKNLVHYSADSSPEAIKAAVIDLMADANKLSRMRQKQLQWIKAHSWEKMSERLYNIIANDFRSEW